MRAIRLLLGTLAVLLACCAAMAWAAETAIPGTDIAVPRPDGGTIRVAVALGSEGALQIPTQSELQGLIDGIVDRMIGLRDDVAVPGLGTTLGIAVRLADYADPVTFLLFNVDPASGKVTAASAVQRDTFVAAIIEKGYTIGASTTGEPEEEEPAVAPLPDVPAPAKEPVTPEEPAGGAAAALPEDIAGAVAIFVDRDAGAWQGIIVAESDSEEQVLEPQFIYNMHINGLDEGTFKIMRLDPDTGVEYELSKYDLMVLHEFLKLELFRIAQFEEEEAE